MAWNEPGGPNDRDPWGNRNKDQEPPDIVEVVNNLQKKLGEVFGGKNNKKGNGRKQGGINPKIGLGIIVFFLFLGWVGSGFYVVDSGKRSVVLLLGAEFSEVGPGMNWYAPVLQSYQIVDVSAIRSLDMGETTDESLMLTRDENIIDVKLTVQYRVASATDYLFNVRDPNSTLKHASESALREIIGKNDMDYVLTAGRTQIRVKIEQLIQEILDRYNTGLEIIGANIQDAQPPEQVQSAFDDAVKAREDKERFINEANAYRNDILPKAEGRAARIEEEAKAYKSKVTEEAQGNADRFDKIRAAYAIAPEVTRDRLYIEAMEEVLSKTNKVLMDNSGGEGNNSLLYLPLDKLMQKQNTNNLHDTSRSLDKILNSNVRSNNAERSDYTSSSAMPKRNTPQYYNLRSRSRGAP